MASNSYLRSVAFRPPAGCACPHCGRRAGVRWGFDHRPTCQLCFIAGQLDAERIAVRAGAVRIPELEAELARLEGATDEEIERLGHEAEDSHYLVALEEELSAPVGPGRN